MSKVKQWFVRVFAWTFWKVVFWYKHKTGFMDLGHDIEVIGTVQWTDGGINGDGDFTFNLKLDPDYSWANYAFGRHTSEDPLLYPDTIHCEITPWMRDSFTTLDSIKPGQRLRVAGRWGFDGVHVGKAEWIEVVYALWRHQPNIIDGWCEIHPVTKVEPIG